MVNHIVCWNFKQELSEAEQMIAGNTIKEKLEAVRNEVEGVDFLEVRIHKLPTSTRDIALISRFESVEALNAYQVSPQHIEAGAYIKTVVCDRVCFDYEE